MDDYQWSADKQHMLIMTESKRVWRMFPRGDFWVLDLPTAALRDGRLTKLGGSAPPLIADVCKILS